jgi:hypothetical protein
MYAASAAHKNGANGKWLSLEYLAALSDSLSPQPIGLSHAPAVPEGLQVDPYEVGDDTLVVVMSGACPSKLHRHGGKEHGLAYGRIRSDISHIQIVTTAAQASLARFSSERDSATTAPPLADGAVDFAHPTEDIFLQAASNGRREVDKLLAAKQQTADTGRGIGDAAEVLAAATMMVPYAGYAFFIVGALSRAASAKTDSTADLRSITGPGCIHIASLKAADEELMIRALGSSGTVIGEDQVLVPRNSNCGMRVVLARVYR